MEETKSVTTDLGFNAQWGKFGAEILLKQWDAVSGRSSTSLLFRVLGVFALVVRSEILGKRTRHLSPASVLRVSPFAHPLSCLCVR